jgi:hypothetical protein
MQNQGVQPNFRQAVHECRPITISLIIIDSIKILLIYVPYPGQTLQHMRHVRYGTAEIRAVERSEMCPKSFLHMLPLGFAQSSYSAGLSSCGMLG